MKARRLTTWIAAGLLAAASGGALLADDSPSTASGGLITFQAEDMPIDQALRLIANQGGLSITVSRGVEGEISAHLSNVPASKAIRLIAESNDYVYGESDGMISITVPKDVPELADAPPMTTRIFTLRWANAEAVKTALDPSLTTWGRITVYNDNSQNLYTVTQISELGGDSEQAGGNGSGSTIATRPSFNNNAQGPGGVGLDQPRNARILIMKDTVENIAILADLIAELDKLPPQVLIEARVVEMTTDFQRELGIDWNIEALANGPVMNHELPLKFDAGFSTGTADPRKPNGDPQNNAGMALGTIDFSRFTAILNLTQQDNAIRLLANPRLLVTNNHSASILVGERYPIIQANITDFGTVTEAFDTYIPVGIQLEVTPTIMIDGTINMNVHPVVSALGDNVTGTTSLQVRRIQIREINTRVNMHDGETIVLGGLISDRKTRSVSKIPGLGDLFGFSLFARSESPGAERVDLLIFVTARIHGATDFDERDREVFEMYKPHFKQVDQLQDVPLHFEAPSEFTSEPPRSPHLEPLQQSAPVSDAMLEEALQDNRSSAGLENRGVSPTPAVEDNVKAEPAPAPTAPHDASRVRAEAGAAHPSPAHVLRPSVSANIDFDRLESKQPLQSAASHDDRPRDTSNGPSDATRSQTQDEHPTPSESSHPDEGHFEEVNPEPGEPGGRSTPALRIRHEISGEGEEEETNVRAAADMGAEPIETVMDHAPWEDEVPCPAEGVEWEEEMAAASAETEGSPLTPSIGAEPVVFESRLAESTAND